MLSPSARPRAEGPDPSPLRDFAQLKDAPREEAVPANTIALVTILISDDNQSAREVLEMMLSSHGYRVFAVSDGQQALQLLQQEAITLPSSMWSCPAKPALPSAARRRTGRRLG